MREAATLMTATRPNERMMTHCELGDQPNTLALTMMTAMGRTENCLKPAGLQQRHQSLHLWLQNDGNGDAGRLLRLPPLPLAPVITVNTCGSSLRGELLRLHLRLRLRGRELRRRSWLVGFQQCSRCPQRDGLLCMLRLDIEALCKTSCTTPRL